MGDKHCLSIEPFTWGHGTLGCELQAREPRRVSGISWAELQEMPTVQPWGWSVPDPQICRQGWESPGCLRTPTVVHVSWFISKLVPSTSCRLGGVHQAILGARNKVMIIGGSWEGMGRV